jgi:hypothetical protein
MRDRHEITPSLKAGNTRPHFKVRNLLRGIRRPRLKLSRRSAPRSLTDRSQAEIFRSVRVLPLLTLRRTSRVDTSSLPPRRGPASCHSRHLGLL